MEATFQVLGEVEVLVDGRPLEVGHARQRWVLACLLVDVNRAVAADQLIYQVWADDPPHRARNALAAYVSRLRQFIGDCDGAEITRVPGGYALRADPMSVDLHRFRALATRARAAGSPTDAAALFDEALGLWHGDPFAALDTPWANEVRTAVAAERFSAELDRNEAALQAGRHRQLLTTLPSALREHPLDERLAEQLMHALARSGRQADALALYREMRQRLVDELGIDPGPSLQAAHQHILDGADAPVPPAPAPAATAADLPRRPTTFVGRRDELAWLGAALQNGAPVTLTGVGGVGKTRLALEVARLCAQRFTDGVAFCELAPLADANAVPQALATALRLHGTSGSSLEDAVIEYLRSRRLLLILDNCEHVLDVAATLAERIGQHCPRVSVLSTSREALGIEGERVFPLSPLRTDDATELFAERARAIRPDFDLQREPVGAVAEICRRLDGVPLAIELAASRMRAMSSLDVARRLDRLRLLQGGTRGAHPRQQSVEATIDWSYRLLSTSEQELFATLSVFSGGFDLEAAHAVCSDADQNSEDDTLDMLTTLVDKSMVVLRSGAGSARYDVLEMLRSYGRERLQEAGSREEVAARHAHYYIGLVERFAAGTRGADEQAWVARMTPDAGTLYRAPDFENVRAAFERVMADGDFDRALRLVTSLLDLMNRIGYHSADWAYRVVEVADPDHDLFPAAVGVAARAAWVLGDFRRARSLVPLADGRVPGPGTSDLAYPADVLADIALYEGDTAAGLRHYERELAAMHEGEDDERLVFLLDRLTMCHQLAGTPDGGVEAGRRALRLADATANPTVHAMARCALGRALAASEPERALRILEDAAEHAALVENNWLTGMARMESAAIRAVHGDPGLAARLFIGSLDHWERGGPSLIPQQWHTVGRAAALLMRLGAESEAATLYCAAVNAGMPPPLSATAPRIACDGVEVPPTGPEIVDIARAALRRFY